MVVSIMIMIIAVMVVVVGPEPVQLQILLLSQFLRELGHSKLLLTWTMMMMMMMMMGMASVIAVVVSMRLMDRRCTGSRMVTLVPKAQIQPKSDNQHYRDLPLQKPHFQFFVAETLISLRKKKKRTEKRGKRGFSKGVFGYKGLGRTALAGALDGDEANSAKKKQDYGDYNTKCEHIHFLFIKPFNLFKACFFLNRPHCSPSLPPLCSPMASG